MSNNQKIYIYSDEVSIRLIYTLDIIFRDRGIKYQIINDPVVFEETDAPKFVYSDKPFKNSYFTISPTELLFEEDIKKQRVSNGTWEGLELLTFRNKPDILASIFYVISLYQEYLSDKKDMHNRAYAKENILEQNGWLEKLMIERWSVKFISLLEKKLDIILEKKEIPFKLIPTFDIDNTYAYKLKSKFRNTLSTGKDVLKFDVNRIKERKRVLSNEQKDPYDTFETILSIKKHGFDVKLFWLLGDFANHDRNISYQNDEHRKLIYKLSKELEIGLHPSYKSNEVLGNLKLEKERLASILERDVSFSRQHFLRLNLPTTYEQLIKEGFTDDYTLGFAEKVGFRAGIARPFPWFNLKKNEITQLNLHPFTYMDGTLNEYLNLSIEEATKKVSQLMDEVKLYGGDFICIWHNETISSYGKWEGWKSVLDHTIQEASSNK